jgi:NAD(P)H-nitrite reductase large subunit
MKSITVLGAGAAGLAFIEAIRAKDADAKITLIDQNVFSFDRRDMVSLFLKKRIDLVEWCSKNKVEFISGTAERVNPSRKKIYFKENDPKGYDLLVVATGSINRKVETKGEHREGFFYLYKMEPFFVRDLLKISGEAVVNISTWLGVKLAFSLKALGKEVRVIAGNWDFLGEYKDRLVKAFEARGIQTHFDCLIEEAIGEGVVKAIKITPLKVFSADLLFIDSGFIANREIFSEVTPGDLAVAKDIYVIGEAANSDIENEKFFAYNYENAKAQGLALAEALLADKPLEFTFRLMTQEEKNRMIEDFLSTVEIKETAPNVGF